MDVPGLDPEAHRRALMGIARVNRLSRTTETLWHPIRELAKKTGRRIRVLDAATGGGDVPARLAEKAARAGIMLELFGCDISETAIACAEERCPGGRFFVHDMLQGPLEDNYDVVMCSLFMHHLSDSDAVVVLNRMKEAANHLVLVNDLARLRFAYFAGWITCHLVSRSRIVWFDGPASVRSSFTVVEAKHLADCAGLAGATVRNASRAVTFYRGLIDTRPSDDDRLPGRGKARWNAAPRTVTESYGQALLASSRCAKYPCIRRSSSSPRVPKICSLRAI